MQCVWCLLCVTTASFKTIESGWDCVTQSCRVWRSVCLCMDPKWCRGSIISLVQCESWETHASIWGVKNKTWILPHVCGLWMLLHVYTVQSVLITLNSDSGNKHSKLKTNPKFPCFYTDWTGSQMSLHMCQNEAHDYTNISTYRH